MTDTALSAVERMADEAYAEAERRYPGGEYMASINRQRFCEGAAWRAQSSEHEAERRRLEQAELEAADAWAAKIWGRRDAEANALMDAYKARRAFLDAERAVEEKS